MLPTGAVQKQSTTTNLPYKIVSF